MIHRYRAARHGRDLAGGSHDAGSRCAGCHRQDGQALAHRGDGRPLPRGCGLHDLRGRALGTEPLARGSRQAIWVKDEPAWSLGRRPGRPSCRSRDRLHLHAFRADGCGPSHAYSSLGRRVAPGAWQGRALLRHPEHRAALHLAGEAQGRRSRGQAVADPAGARRDYRRVDHANLPWAHPQPDWNRRLRHGGPTAGFRECPTASRISICFSSWSPSRA